MQMNDKVVHEEQPLPIKNDTVDIQTLVIKDVEHRREIGIDRYGTALQINNGRSMLRDAYEEVLDLAVYIKGEVEERKAFIDDLSDLMNVADTMYDTISHSAGATPIIKEYVRLSEKINTFVAKERRSIMVHEIMDQEESVLGVISGISTSDS